MTTDETMRGMAKAIDTALNGPGAQAKKVGFALLTYSFGEDLKGTGRVNYVGNGEREDVLAALKEVVARWEGRYQDGGRA